jgi:tripartite-type tricarboxylate transporter receptor subunit TctC
MTRTLGQQVIVENVIGAGGTAAAARLSNAEPDGYTMLIHHIALAAGASLYKNLSYKTEDLQPIGLVNYGPMVLAGRKDYPASNAGELLAKLKSDGPKTNLAHGGVGSNSHLCNLLLQQALGIKMNEVAYRGTGPAMNDLIGGQIDLMFDQSTTAVAPIQAGLVKGFAVTSPQRLDVLPDLPTLKEVGLPDVEFMLWHGLYIPKGTPDAIVAKLNSALGAALQDKVVRERFASSGTQLFPENEWTPAAHRQRFRKELATWKEVITKSGISVGD